jgi:hypothetical protein
MTPVLDQFRYGVAYTAEMNFLNDATIPGLPADFGTDMNFTFPGVYPGPSQTQTSTQASGQDTGPYTGPFATKSVGGEPFAVLIGAVLILLGIKWLSERPSTLGGANPAFIRIGGYNFLVIAFMVALASILWKVVALYTKRVPGVNEFAVAAG